jgi:hypothetical protein
MRAFASSFTLLFTFFLCNREAFLEELFATEDRVEFGRQDQLCGLMFRTSPTSTLEGMNH